MHDLQRLRYVIHRYPHLQGLRIAPLGIPFLLSAAWHNGQFHWVPGTDGHGAWYWFLALMAIAVAGGLGIGRYYQERFGALQPARGWRSPLLACLFVAGMFAAVWIQDGLDTSIPLPVIVIGLGLTYVGCAGGTTRTHYLVIAAVTFAFATLNAFGVPASLRQILSEELIGLGLIVVGVGDHLLLQRAMEADAHVQRI
jgi:hypothetical protein